MSEVYFDVLIVGAGLSGIGAGVHLQQQCPHRTYAILEGREKPGGTWDLFQYPGIRSDSDMHTMGYEFKPWRAVKSIADGPSILEYITQTATEYGIEDHIRYQHRVESAHWSSDEGLWRVETKRTDSGETVHLTCNVLYMCAGYYSYRGGYTPDFKGSERFIGPIVHPQKWPEDLDYQDKRVVIIGSGATAITLVPALAAKAAHVTMLQRSPTYVFAWPDEDAVANALNAVLPAKMAYAITRQKNIWAQQLLYRFSQRNPEKAKARLLSMLRKELGPGFDIEKHFTPRYYPWEQRLCIAPNGDLFTALKSGKASVVTEHIDCFTENGITLKSGTELAADLIVTATGLNLVIFGEVDFSVDGQPVDFSNTWSYKGVAASDVPNLFACFGYVNASWTLRADLISQYVCRVLNHMEKTGTRQCTPRLRPSDEGMPKRNWVDDFNPGYIQRTAHLFPSQSDRVPWSNPQNYKKDKKMLGTARVDDGVLTFTNPAPSPDPENAL